MNEVVPVLSAEGSPPAQMLTLCAKAVFHAPALINAFHYAENRRNAEVHSLFQVCFSFLIVCQRREHYDFSNHSSLFAFFVAF